MYVVYVTMYVKFFACKIGVFGLADLICLHFNKSFTFNPVVSGVH